jgi:multidrug efflux pump subunit AcrA (membrane-fusion protein)
MLNLSKNNIDLKSIKQFSTVKRLEEQKLYAVLNKIVLAFVAVTFVLLFLPWTQNIRGSGFVTTLKPSQRPQTIQSIIPGRIEQWYVQEGDYVNKGDTILHISEVKESYLDPNLVKNTQGQLESKRLSVVSYKQKVIALDSQIKALENELKINLLDKSKVAFLRNDEVFLENLVSIKSKVQADEISADLLTFNNMVANKEDFDTNWLIPAQKSWMGRFFKMQA